MIMPAGCRVIAAVQIVRCQALTAWCRDCAGACSAPGSRGQTVSMIPGSSPTKGRLLVATPPLDDPNFDRTVIFVLEHHDEGALGLVLNRPSPEELGDALRAWATMQSDPSLVFVGGPVEPDALIAIARVREATGVELDPEHLAPLSGDLAS